MINLIPYPKQALVTGLVQKFDSSTIKYIRDASIKAEGYELSVMPEGITIKYSDEDGKYYAGLSLSQLVKNGYVPQCNIIDEPRYHYRGFMLDSSRHFQPIEDVKNFIRGAALFKFNYFHWHLSDDQGYRIESTKYPFMNKVGSYRDKIGFNNETPGVYGGYYTKDEIRQVVELCAKLHIQVIPELDMPGHTASWVASYASLGCTGENVKVKWKNGIKKDILCAGREETYEFCCNLIDEVAELFPCKYFHIGGDEVPKDHWKKCPDCQAKMKEHKLKNEEQLQGYFTNRIVNHLKSIGKTAIVWNDALSSGLVKNDVVVANWWDARKKVPAFANNGGYVIGEKTSGCYIDQPASIVPLENCYNYDIVPKKVRKGARVNFIGIETPMWTEWIEDFVQLSYMTYPRIMAVAENGWTAPEKKNYESFRKRIKAYYPALAKYNITVAPASDWDPSPARKAKMNADWAKNFRGGANND